MKKDVLFLDANILFSAAYRENSGLLQFWKLKGARLVSSVYAIEEARRNLETLKQKERLEKLIDSVETFPFYVDDALPENIALKEKDRPILLAAISVQADYLITGDKRDFGQFYGKAIKGVTVIPPSDYLKKSNS